MRVVLFRGSEDDILKGGIMKTFLALMMVGGTLVCEEPIHKIKMTIELDCKMCEALQKYIEAIPSEQPDVTYDLWISRTCRSLDSFMEVMNTADVKHASLYLSHYPPEEN